ncbi:hypothetical protein ACFRMQ_37240 [Kitasatospora sp. NPDC056783]|uniref:hypothetical protein n=1 Tax=Kitasatospora sp. NPDC056783 TaxID=3345943 RepID=UPI0036C69DFA
MPPDVARPQNLQRHQVVLDLSRLDENGKPREFVFVEPYLGSVILRPLGYSAPEHQADPSKVKAVEPVEIAAGTAGDPHRRRVDGGLW